MTQFKKDFIETLKNAVDIVTEISEAVELKQSGENFIGLCPFHDEKNPSFNVYSETQTWHCFGCEKSGDVISFVMEKEHLSFRDALLHLAEKYNVPIPEEEPEGVDVTGEIRRTAVEFYHSVLFQETGAEALAYLTETRGL